MGSVNTYLYLKEIQFFGKITYGDYVPASLETSLDRLERDYSLEKDCCIWQLLPTTLMFSPSISLNTALFTSHPDTQYQHLIKSSVASKDHFLITCKLDDTDIALLVTPNQGEVLSKNVCFHESTGVVLVADTEFWRAIKCWMFYIFFCRRRATFQFPFLQVFLLNKTHLYANRLFCCVWIYLHAFPPSLSNWPLESLLHYFKPSLVTSRTTGHVMLFWSP